MVSQFHSFTLASTIFLVIYSSLVRAAPWPLHAKHATHRVRHVGRSLLQVHTYHPKTTFKTWKTGKNQQGSSLVATSSLKDSAISFVQSELGVDAALVGYKSGYNNKNGKVAYVKQYHDGIPFANAVANIAWNNGKVVAFGSSFVDTNKKIASSTPSLNVTDVIPELEVALDGKYNDHPTSLEYLVKDDNSVALTHVVQIRNETAGTWFESFVCAHTGKIVSVTDFVSHASYTVLPITEESFTDGQEKLVDPQDLLASPLGWHDNSTVGNATVGNNVAAFSGNKVTGESSPGLNFNVKYDDTLDPKVPSNLAASRINAFYISNTVHDFAYRYGFTEEAFNFQEDNFGKGGRGDDRVLVSVQDPSGFNNANFASPPDGQPGVCRMFIWTETNPRRDGAMENDILVHELAHGITNRLTGGGTGRCLQTVESGGLGEGWSDAMAEWVSQKSPQVKDFAVGTYVTGDPKGIRSFLYSTDSKVNPLRYSSLAKLNEVHKIGEVWANMLHNVYAALVAKHGFSNNALTNPDTDEGNVVYMHLFMDALALQPCNPTFIAARDAWIQADENRYNGTHKCLVFKEFARLGLGLNSGPDFVDNDDLPKDC